MTPGCRELLGEVRAAAAWPPYLLRGIGCGAGGPVRLGQLFSHGIPLPCGFASEIVGPGHRPLFPSDPYASLIGVVMHSHNPVCRRASAAGLPSAGRAGTGTRDRWNEMCGVGRSRVGRPTRIMQRAVGVTGGELGRALSLRVAEGVRSLCSNNPAARCTAGLHF